MTLRPARGVHLFLLDESGLLFSEQRQELHVLNTSAAVIWSLMESGLDETAIEADLRGRFGLDQPTAAAFVRDAAAEWSSKGFLAGTDAEPPLPPAPDVAGPNLADVPPYPATWPTPPRHHDRRHYALRGAAITFRFASAAQAALIDPVLAHLAAPEAGDAIIFDLIETASGIAFYRDGEPWCLCSSPEALASHAKAAAWNAGLLGGEFFLNIHAGVVAGPNGCVLLPANPGSGKSTLTAGLMHAGLDYFSDEVALLADETMEVIPFPLALCVKEPGIAPLAGRFPQLLALPVHRRPDGKRVVYLPPLASRVPPPRATRPVAAIVFPRYEVGAPLACRPLPRVEALARLLEHCIGVAHPLDVARVRRLVEWIADVACRDIVFSDLAEAVEAIAPLAGPLEVSGRSGWE